MTSPTYPEDVAWLRANKDQFMSTEGVPVVESCAPATTEPYRLTFPRFVVDLLLRGDDLLLQFHLPYPLHPLAQTPAWWTTTFPSTLSDTALSFFGHERKADLRAVHTRLTQPHSTEAIDSWYFEARRQSFFTTSRESSAMEFLDHLSKELDQALQSSAP